MGEILGVIGVLIVALLCFLYYIKHCFGICFANENKIIFNENTMKVEIIRNDVLIESIPFTQFNGLQYEDHYVFVSFKTQPSIPLNIYRADAQTAKDFVITVAEIWTLMIKKNASNDFQAISV